jgi:hypothetical protein
MENAKKSAEERRKDWVRHLQYWRSSKLSPQAYCQRHSLKYWAFRYWRKRLEQNEPTPPVTIVQLPDKIGGMVSHRTTTFKAEPIHLWVGKYRIELAEGFSADQLARLVRLLQTI